MIDALQSLAFTKLDKSLLSIKSPIDQHGLTFILALLPLFNSQSQSKNKRLIQNTYIESDNGSFGSKKLIKALLDLPIFINGNDPSID